MILMSGPIGGALNNIVDDAGGRPELIQLPGGGWYRKGGGANVEESVDPKVVEYLCERE